ncbi:lipid A export ATP-binding/permease protein msbA [Viridothelium virens]|uniref:Lipid A export ATP-binding/permease protein msbA n=1 Tax=Viridothelium virens TaxID=1048519 RepID=A0A6A6GWA5_VIRVR|nr:lipid A export ATP-binding/permease protein msbA [Viridothelium virens]
MADAAPFTTVPQPPDIDSNIQTTSLRSDGLDTSKNDYEKSAVREHEDSVIDVKATTNEDPASKAKSEQENTTRFFKDFSRLLSYATTIDRVLFIFAVICSAGSGTALPLMNIVVFGKLSVNFTEYSIPGSGVSKNQFLSQLDHNALYIVYLFIGRFTLEYVSIFAFRMVGIRISAAIRLAYLSALLGQSISVVDKLPSGSATDSLTTAANTIQMGISDKLGLLIQSLSLLITAYVVAFKWSWKLTLVSSSSIVFVVLAYSVIMPFWIKLYRAVIKYNAEAAGIAGEAFQSIRTVKALCAEDAMIRKHAEWISKARRKGVQMSPWSAAQYAPAYFSIYGNMALTFWLGVHLYSKGEITNIGNVLTVLFSVLLVVTAIGGIFAPLQGLTKAITASAPLLKVIDSPTSPTSGLRNPDVQANSDIYFHDVSFAYPNRPYTQVLKGLDLVIPAGKITALVGPSGCGKSTLVGLLERWYQLSDINERLENKTQDKKLGRADKKKEKAAKKEKKAAQGTLETFDKSGQRATATEKDETAAHLSDDQQVVLQNSGSILVGDHPIESLDLTWWRSSIGLVQQEPFLFNKTVFENVELGLVGSQWEHESADVKRKLVQRACEDAFADEFIQRLPQRYETMVGESGIKLSGGQRQRIAIARSIVKQPSILILDEATSAIDIKGERIVQAALDRVSKGRTTITIAHRLSTIKKADHIIVLKEGRAVESGTHDGLLGKSEGLYASLVLAQHLELGASDDEDQRLENGKSWEPLEDLLTTQRSEEQQVHNQQTENDRKLRSFVRSMGLLVYEQRRHYILYLLIISTAGSCGAVFATQSFLTSNLITVFQFTGSKLIERGNFWSLMFFVLALFVGLAYGVIGFCTNAVSTHLSSHYRQEYFESIIRKPISFFDKEGNSSGTLTGRVSNDPTQIQELLGPNMALPLIGLFNMIACTIISFVFGWKLTLVSLSGALPVILGAAYMRMRYELQFESYNAKVFAESSEFAAEAIGAFRTVAALTMEHSISSRYEVLLKDHVDKAFRKARYAVLVFSLSDSVELLCMALCLWYGGQLIANREYDIQSFFVIYIAIVQNGQQAGQFLAFTGNAANATAAANRIIDFREGSEFQHEDQQASPQQILGDEKREGFSVDFRHVDFTYPTRETPVFHDLNISIGTNKYVAIVGPSGCGKSTITALLARFYEVSAGEIQIDGVDISNTSINEYRSQISLVSQEPTIFKGTVRENLILGLPDADSISNADIEEACSAAQIHDFVISLPDGYSTALMAGTHASMSGGQKQRMCIARALLRRPRLLLLDEATSALDSQNERLVQTVVEEIASRGNVTVVVVAHRLSTVQNVDRIIVLGESGRIMEEGSHMELLQKKGVYWGMCQAQALDR